MSRKPSRRRIPDGRCVSHNLMTGQFSDQKEAQSVGERSLDVPCAAWPPRANSRVSAPESWCSRDHGGVRREFARGGIAPPRGRKVVFYFMISRADSGAFRTRGCMIGGAEPRDICLLPGAARRYAFGTISPSSVRSRARTAGEHAARGKMCSTELDSLDEPLRQGAVCTIRNDPRGCKGPHSPQKGR